MSNSSTYRPHAVDVEPSGLGHFFRALLRATPLYLFATGVKAALAGRR